ncbi:zinc finger C2HC domain-containing protein 1C isoform X2 [Octodon degus]|uniref:Zinc finger C2HC domain-containing protein 1C isoform X2 n=1 Tax=Octodon degus TaxID=10160 RepID=A0A6P6DHN1_OCTDE|nr:zinc finger C2HC domain-containing protein 1C isoform X2 [Octodon degus]
MAGPQLAPQLPVGVMFPHNKTEALHSTKQDPYEQGDSSLQSSSMGHLKSFQQKPLSKKDLQPDVYTHAKWNTCLKAQGYFYSHCAGISERNSGSHSQGQVRGFVHSSSPQSRYPKANDQDLVPVTKKQVGVDRAYPLKPMVYHKSCGTGEAGTDRYQHIYPRPPRLREFSDSNFGLRNWANSSVLTATQGEAMANLHWLERKQLQRLEAAGESLEEEIRRKESLLREKLKKTEAELRRIQREREQAKENEERELQRMIQLRRVKGSYTTTPYKPVFPPEFGTEEVFSRDRREDETWGLLQEDSSPIQLSDYGIQRLKKERLVANNNKMQDRASGSLEKFFQPSEEAGGNFQESSSSGPSRVPEASGSVCSTEEEPALAKCSHCGRTFLLPRLERHSAICSKMQGPRRKVFNSSRARAKGTELEQYLNWNRPATVKNQGLNSGPCACQASAYSTEPSPQPLAFISFSSSSSVVLVLLVQ